MNVHPDETTGIFVAATKALPMVEVDASDWENDIPAEEWATGDFVAAVGSLPMIEMDTTNWDR